MLLLPSVRQLPRPAQWRPGCLLLLALGLGQRAQAQVVRYRNGPGKPLYSAAQLDSVVQTRSAKLASLGMLLESKITGQEQRHDTLLYTYALRASTAGVRTNEQRYQALVGKPLPDFALRDLAGQPVTAASLRGRPAVLNLWFTTCAPCLAEIPALNRFRQQHPDVAFLALTYEPARQVQTFLQQRPFSWQHLPDAAAYCAQFTQNYPLSVFVNRSGIIQQIIGGMPQRFDQQTKQLSPEVNEEEFAQALKSIE
jgi:thiol-disulfide isomerase/thioredoxin